MEDRRETFLKKLSPDLRKLFDQAEALIEESLYRRALEGLKKVESFLPGDEFLLSEIEDCEERAKVSSGPAAGGTETFQNNFHPEGMNQTIKNLARDLGLSKELLFDESEIPELNLALNSIGSFSNSRPVLDVSIFAGVSNNWQFALRAVNKCIDSGESSDEIYVWKLSCLVNLESFAEAVALFSSRHWSLKVLIHVNFLAALAYEGLGVLDQAKSRFKAVYDVNPQYGEVAQKLLNY